MKKLVLMTTLLLSGAAYGMDSPANGFSMPDTFRCTLYWGNVKDGTMGSVWVNSGVAKITTVYNSGTFEVASVKMNFRGYIEYLLTDKDGKKLYQLNVNSTDGGGWLYAAGTATSHGQLACRRSRF